jgi:hypothetical protein
MKNETHYDHLVRLLSTARTDASRYFLIPRYESLEKIVRALPDTVWYSIRFNVTCALEVSPEENGHVGWEIRWSPSANSWRGFIGDRRTSMLFPSTHTKAIVEFLAAVR